MNLSKRIINEIIDISKKYYGINKVVLFGSRARGDNELKSDIDLAIYCDGDLSLFIEEVENTTHTLLEFDFSDMIPKAQSTKAKLSKQGYIILKIFCTVKERINKMKK